MGGFIFFFIFTLTESRQLIAGVSAGAHMEDTNQGERMYKATIKYRDEFTRGNWREHSVTAETPERARAMVLSHCDDCEHTEPIVEKV